LQDIVQATLIQPPLDVQGRKDGFNVIYHLNDLGFPFVYSSVFTNFRTLKEKPLLVQRFVAGLAETVYFVEKNPQPAMAAVGKTLSIKDLEVLQSAYDAYAVRLVNRRMIVPAKLVAETIETAREEGTNIRRQHVCRESGKKRLSKGTLERRSPRGKKKTLGNAKQLGI
jgi:hypothetical protein